MKIRDGDGGPGWNGIRGKRLGVIVLLLITVLASVLGVADRSAGPATPAVWTGPRTGGLWTATGLREQTNALLADPARPAVLFAGTDDGAWQSLDAGTSWERAGMRGRVITALAVDTGGTTLYAGDEDGVVHAAGGILGSVAWQAASSPLGGTPIFSLAVAHAPPVILAGTSGALYRGARGAHGWQWKRTARTDDASISSIVWFPATGSHVMASVFGVTPPVMASDDDGSTWHAAAGGLPAELPTETLLALDTQPPAVILTTMGGGVWERPAEGSWHDISQGLPERHAMPLVALAGHGPPLLYAGTMGYGIYVKQGTSAWQQLGRGLIGAQNTILALALAGASADATPTLLAATQYGVYRYAPSR